MGEKEEKNVIFATKMHKIFAQAKPTIQEVIGKIACGTDNASPMNRYTAPDRFQLFLSRFPFILYETPSFWLLKCITDK